MKKQKSVYLSLKESSTDCSHANSLPEVARRGFLEAGKRGLVLPANRSSSNSVN